MGSPCLYGLGCIGRLALSGWAQRGTELRPVGAQPRADGRHGPYSAEPTYAALDGSGPYSPYSPYSPMQPWTHTALGRPPRRQRRGANCMRTSI